MRLEIKNLCKTYKKGLVKALDDFSVTLTPGVYGLLGPNGAGESTLMNIITDNLNADSGEVLYDGEEIKKLGKDYRTVLGYMPQQQGLYDDFTLNRFLWYMAALKGLKKKEAKQKIASLLETVNLKESAHKKLGSFSGGMKQRVVIAMALACTPKRLLADEPTGNVDPEMSHEIIELLNEINATGTTVIVVTHEHDLVREFDRRVVVLDHGKIKSDTKDLFVKDDYADDYGDDSGEEENTPDYPDNAVVVPE